MSSIVRHACLTTAWTLLALLMLLSLTVAIQPVHYEFEVGAVALAPWLYFLAWPISIAAVAQRRWAMAGVAVGLIVLQVALVLPLWWPGARAAEPTGTWRLKIFDGNVRYGNADLAEIAGEIRRDRPDVVTLEELSPENLPSLVRTGVMSGYRWHIVHVAPGSSGFGVWSDVSLDGADVWNVAQHPEIEATLRPTTGVPIRILVIHTLAPLGSAEPALWARELDQIRDKVRDQSRPLIVVGDFNATSLTKRLRGIVDQGLADAAVESGDGWQMTWPRNLRVLPPFFRPDHLLYSAGLTVTSYKLGVGAGSDHRPILVTLARAAG